MYSGSDAGAGTGADYSGNAFLTERLTHVLLKMSYEQQKQGKNDARTTKFAVRVAV